MSLANKLRNVSLLSFLLKPESKKGTIEDNFIDGKIVNKDGSVIILESKSMFDNDESTVSGNNIDSALAQLDARFEDGEGNQAIIVTNLFKITNIGGGLDLFDRKIHTIPIKDLNRIRALQGYKNKLPKIPKNQNGERHIFSIDVRDEKGAIAFLRDEVIAVYTEDLSLDNIHSIAKTLEQIVENLSDINSKKDSNIIFFEKESLVSWMENKKRDFEYTALDDDYKKHLTEDQYKRAVSNNDSYISIRHQESIEYLTFLSIDEIKDEIIDDEIKELAIYTKIKWGLNGI